MYSSSCAPAQHLPHLPRWNFSYRLPSPTRRKNAQSRKSRRRGSVATERRFLNKTSDLHQARLGAPASRSSGELHTLPTAPVSTPVRPTSTPVTTPYTTPIEDDLIVTQDDLDFLEKHLKEANDNEEKPKAKNGAARAAKPKRPALWRDIGIKSRMAYTFREIEAAHGEAHVFTLRIDPALLADQANPANVMNDRIRDALKAEFGRNLPIAGVMEWRGEHGDELHIHGVIGGLTDNDLLRARRALRAAGGPWRDNRANGVQVDLKPIDDARGGVDGWAEYCTKDTAATQAEIERRREVLGDQSARSPRVDFASREIQQAAKETYERDRMAYTSPDGRMAYSEADDRKAYTSPGDRKPYSLTITSVCHTETREPYETVCHTERTPDLAKTQTQRTNEYRARIKEERDALQAENAELKRRLAETDETSTTPARPSPLEKLSPDALAAFDEMRPIFRGATDEEKIVDLIGRAVLTIKKSRTKTAAPGPSVASSMTEREIIEGIYGQLIDQAVDDHERDAARAARDEMLAEGLYEVAEREFAGCYKKHLKRLGKEASKKPKHEAAPAPVEISEVDIEALRAELTGTEVRDIPVIEELEPSK